MERPVQTFLGNDVPECPGGLGAQTNNSTNVQKYPYTIIDPMSAAFKKAAKKSQVAFVASTLPIQFIFKNRDELNIKEIVMSSEIFVESYNYLLEKLPFVKLSIVPYNLIFHLVYLFFKIILARISAKEVVFFHECGWPIFDLLIKLIKPKGLYCPQVKMASFSPVIDDEPRSQNCFKEILFKWVFKKYFILYKAKADGGEYYYYVWSARNYPSSVKISPEYYSFAMRDQKANHRLTKRILFLVGREPVQDNNLIFILDSLCKIAQKNGYEIVIKDHPRLAARLNFNPNGATIINPAKPVELLEEDFDFVVGVASTGLIAFPNRAISIIHLLDEMSTTDKQKRISHLLNLSGADKLIILNSMDEFEPYLTWDVESRVELTRLGGHCIF